MHRSVVPQKRTVCDVNGLLFGIGQVVVMRSSSSSSSDDSSSSSDSSDSSKSFRPPPWAANGMNAGPPGAVGWGGQPRNEGDQPVTLRDLTCVATMMQALTKVDSAKQSQQAAINAFNAMQSAILQGKALRLLQRHSLGGSSAQTGYMGWGLAQPGLLQPGLLAATSSGFSAQNLSAGAHPGFFVQQALPAQVQVQQPVAQQPVAALLGGSAHFVAQQPSAHVVPQVAVATQATPQVTVATQMAAPAQVATQVATPVTAMLAPVACVPVVQTTGTASSLAADSAEFMQTLMLLKQEGQLVQLKQDNNLQYAQGQLSMAQALLGAPTA
eukprot:Gregarina_sp_Pseudo_9__5249@NODE_596_length_2524_cov_39_433803_g562_i0_p2_GENE_NODE_596_length_2524_cov_39_433803_g562_i0NODE_596_length_2524_cov_39_433803_g562_i0_p2_ORF_typecomplete_len327_score64_54DUF4692/PF15763_5/5_3_NODE_596_length_2524_cov_39_433803_g562_i0951075